MDGRGLLMQLIKKIKKLKDGSERWSIASEDKEIALLLTAGFVKINRIDLSFTDSGIKALTKAINVKK
ncbi:MAG: hypothetical protein ACHQ1D_00680 [Nitrososphaerales archaeon]